MSIFELLAGRRRRVFPVFPLEHIQAAKKSSKTSRADESKVAFSLSVQSGWSDKSVFKLNARVIRTGSGQNDPAHGPEPAA